MFSSGLAEIETPDHVRVPTERRFQSVKPETLFAVETAPIGVRHDLSAPAQRPMGSTMV